MKKIKLTKQLSVAMAITVAASSMAMPVSASAVDVAETETMVIETEVEETAAPETETETEVATESEESGIVYGTINLPYAEYFYGELNDITGDLEVSVPDFTNLDPVSSERGEGLYDAVTSATTTKSKRYEVTYWDETNPTIPGGVDIQGIKEVPVAMNKELYDAVKAETVHTDSKLYEYVQNLTVVDGVTYEEYKVLNADGTFSKMETQSVIANDLEAHISTTSAWGNYQISVEGFTADNKPTTADMLGVILTTSDGAKYGLKHSDNLWLQTQEIAFAAQAGFVEPHGNTIQYQRFADIQGKEITEITYLIKDKADIVIPTNLKVKCLFDKESYSISAADTIYNSAGTQIPVTISAPSGSNYVLTSVANSAGELEEAAYTFSENTLNLSGNCHPGAYTLTFEDAEYETIKVSTVVLSQMDASAVKAAYNKLSVQDQITSLDEYLSEITSLVVNGETISGSGIGKLAFGADGTVDFSAKTTGRGAKEIFAQGAAGDYMVKIVAAGFPDVTIQVGASYVKKAVQTIKVASAYNKTYGNAAFNLGATADGKLTYTSSNAKVVTVDAKGNVTIKGAGTAVVTVNAEATEIKDAAQAKVTITVAKAAAKVSASSVTKTYGAKAFNLNAKSTGGTMSYKSADSKIAAVAADGTVTIKGTGKTTITITAAENANYKKAECKINVTVKPKKQKASVKAAGAKKVTVTWKKDSKVTGYEIKLSLNKKFTKSVKTVSISKVKTIKKTIKGLKSGKKYYIKVRAYKKSGTTKIYGAYSAVKTVKVK